jgi:hypothetical protein
LVHEIKHDGFPAHGAPGPRGIRLITRRGNDWMRRYPLVAEAVNHSGCAQCLIDGEVGPISNLLCTSNKSSLRCWKKGRPMRLARRINPNAFSPEQEKLCERVENREPAPRAAALIRQQAQEIDDLWDRLSHAYALVRPESPAEMIQEEMEALRPMLEERRSSQLKKS